MSPGYRHGEAFCLMRYRDEVTGEVEVIWNSRDGVTPFIVMSRAGNRATHVEWHLDERRVFHVPKVGDRIFVDMTPTRARELAEQNVERWWDGADGVPPMREAFDSKEEAIATLEANYYQPGRGDPDIVEVTDRMRGQFLLRAAGGA